MSLDKIPEVKLVHSGKRMYRVFFGRREYTLFCSQILEKLISLSWETDEMTGKKYFYIIFNPNFLAPSTSQKYWKPPIVHEIAQALSEPEYGYYIKDEHDNANGVEAQYCLDHFTKEERTRYLGIVSSLLGKNHPKFKFLEERLR